MYKPHPQHSSMILEKKNSKKHLCKTKLIVCLQMADVNNKVGEICVFAATLIS